MTNKLTNRSYFQNPRFEYNGDIGSCDNSSDVTKNKLTATIVIENVGMLTDVVPSADDASATAAGNLNGRSAEQESDPVKPQASCVETSGLTCSTSKVRKATTFKNRCASA